MTQQQKQTPIPVEVQFSCRFLTCLHKGLCLGMGECYGGRQDRPLRKFDEALKSITTERGAVYGHPADDFAAAAKLKAALPEFSDPRIRHVAEMIAIKLARLSATPNHLDSWIDIAGYARTAVMILDRETK